MAASAISPTARALPATPGYSVRKPVNAGYDRGALADVPPPADVTPGTRGGAALAASPKGYFDSRARTEAQRYYPRDFTGSISGGWRADNARFNIAGDPTGKLTPNILSELKWRSVDTYQVKGEAAYTKQKGTLAGLHLEGSARKAWAWSGDNQDSDYLGDDRTAEFSRSNNKASDSDMYGYSAGIGYAFFLNGFVDPNDIDGRLSLTPILGYSYDKDNFAITDGFQTIPAYGAFPGLHSSYDMTWKGPFLGLSVDGSYQSRIYYTLRGEYHHGDYSGQGHWNLRSDFRQNIDSFEHDADGDGFVVSGRIGYTPVDNLELFLAAAFESWTTGHGTDTTFLSDGSSVETRFNKAEWNTREISLGVAYHF